MASLEPLASGGCRLRLGAAGNGKARIGTAGRGEAWEVADLVKNRPAPSAFPECVWPCGLARRGLAWRGVAWHGGAGQGKGGGGPR